MLSNANMWDKTYDESCTPPGYATLMKTAHTAPQRNLVSSVDNECTI